MREVLISILRDKNTTTFEFRRAASQLAGILCVETLDLFPKEGVSIQTPIGKTEGVEMPIDILLVPILRSGMALLSAFLEILQSAPVGIIGLKRDEKTAKAKLYYKNLPKDLPKYAIILDPMLATGGSAAFAVDILKKEGYKPENIFFTGVVAAQEGFDKLAKKIPEENITLGVIDPKLNDKKYIVPGLGDFGDRYFNTI
ncbi:uracil phosphoribosyltransferase [Candidatus Azambacteria bacterium]|nr:uracil phosphoribosyltransferase [Candidatus Azambacteria bacterium]